MRIDFHSHILPNMDDGSSGIDESLKLLQMLADQNVEKVILTSHFYRQNENIEKFISRREQAYAKLKEAVDGNNNYPETLLGAEVYFYPSLSSDPDFHRLCIENTDYILLELPFELFHDNFYSSFSKFINNCEHKIILAHIERYLNFGNSIDDILRLFDYGDFICQMNCTSLATAGFTKRRVLSKMINSGLISVIGTDTHNTSSRPPMYDKAEKVIIKKCGKDNFDRICKNSELVLSDCKLSDVK